MYQTAWCRSARTSKSVNSYDRPLSALATPEVVTHVLRPQLLAALEARLGQLAVDEVYYPVPFPFLGGSGAPETFAKGNVWVFASIVGQSWGLLTLGR